MKKLIALIAMLAAATAYTAGPVTIYVVAEDNDVAVTQRVVRVKAASRGDLDSWLTEQQLQGNTLKKSARMCADVLAPHITNNIDGRVLTRLRADAVNNVTVVGSGE